jgi:hypothetical protein
MMIHDVTLSYIIPNEKQPNNPTYVYTDTNGDEIAFKSTNTPFVFASDPNHTSKCYLGNTDALQSLTDGFVQQGMKQHEYEGGFEEAIQTITIEYP